MKLLVSIFMILGSFAWAADEAQVAQPTNKNLKRNLDFEDLLVKGKYHFSSEAVVTVEDDKILDALLEVRKDFRDRLAKSSSSH